MASHHQPHLIIDNTHRVTLANEWCDEHLAYAEELQREDYEPRVYTGDEVRFAFFLGGLFFSLVFATVAWIIAGMPL